MAILTPSQLQAASNATYFDNTSGSITPTSVRTLNDNWISSSVLATQTGSMTVATASFASTASFALNFNPSATASYALFALTASNAISASYALQALNATNATNASTADTATFASTANTANSANTAVSSNTAISASFATTASFALNFNPAATASYALFALTASYALNVPTASVSASYALTASKVSILDDNGNNNHKVTFVNTAVASGGEQILIDPTATQFTYNPSTNLLVVTASLAQVAVSASRAISAANADNATTASYASNAELLDNLNFTAFVLTSSFSPFSGSIAGRVTTLETAGYATLAGNNTFTGNNIFGNVTASNALITNATVQNLTVIYETASIIYSSGSNQFGDAANDTQTLYGTVIIPTGSLIVSGSSFQSGTFYADQIVFPGVSGSFSSPTLAFGSDINPIIGYPGIAMYTNFSESIAQGGGVFSGMLSQDASYGPGFGTIGFGLSTFNGPGTVEGCFYGLGTGSNGGDNTMFKTKLDSNNLFVYRNIELTGSLTVTQNITANLIGTASYASNANTATTALTASSISTLNQAVIITGSLLMTGSTTFNGPFNGNVISASIASNTSSLNFSQGNFYTSLVSGSTNFNITNPKAGQTVNLLLSTVGVASASFSSNVKQVSGSAYTPTSGSGKNDILTFISWDGSSVYLANVKNLI